MKREQGYLLLELMIVCTVVMILAAMAMPNAIAMRRVEQAGQAKKQAVMIYQAMIASATCHAATVNNPSGWCTNVDNVIPQTGTSMKSGGYNFRMQNPGGGQPWNYTATPLTDTTLPTVYIDGSGQLACDGHMCKTGW